MGSMWRHSRDPAPVPAALRPATLRFLGRWRRLTAALGASRGMAIIDAGPDDDADAAFAVQCAGLAARQAFDEAMEAWAGRD